MPRSGRRRHLRWALAVVVAVAAGVVFTRPEAREAADGPADPILVVRRPILRAMRGLGLAGGPSFFDHDDWLPSRLETTSMSGQGEDESFLRTYGTWTRWRRAVRPVYRAVFFRVGRRVRFTRDASAEAAKDVLGIRMFVVREGRREIVADDYSPIARDADGLRWTVSAYVDDDAEAFGAEELRLDGSVGDRQVVGTEPSAP
jgi:hypothetical protein